MSEVIPKTHRPAEENPVGQSADRRRVNGHINGTRSLMSAIYSGTDSQLPYDYIRLEQALLNNVDDNKEEDATVWQGAYAEDYERNEEIAETKVQSDVIETMNRSKLRTDILRRSLEILEKDKKELPDTIVSALNIFLHDVKNATRDLKKHYPNLRYEVDYEKPYAGRLNYRILVEKWVTFINTVVTIAFNQPQDTDHAKKKIVLLRKKVPSVLQCVLKEDEDVFKVAVQRSLDGIKLSPEWPSDLHGSLGPFLDELEKG